MLLYIPKEEVEPDALKQLIAVAESPLPAGDSYVSAMPDCHLGKGVTIGTVFASEQYVCPNAVGVDIGATVRPLVSVRLSTCSNGMHAIAGLKQRRRQQAAACAPCRSRACTRTT